ncbi:MAG TPA: hypothetical protein VGE74_07500 [Gemmata sp.]
MNWIRKETNSDVPQTRYELVLPDARIAVTYTIPRARPDVVTLQFISPNGALIDSWAIEEPDYNPEYESLEQADPDGDWRLLDGLFDEIHRQVTGWDKVISHIEQQLASPGTIGQPTSGSGVVTAKSSVQGIGSAPQAVMVTKPMFPN